MLKDIWNWIKSDFDGPAMMVGGLSVALLFLWTVICFHVGMPGVVTFVGMIIIAFGGSIIHNELYCMERKDDELHIPGDKED